MYGGTTGARNNPLTKRGIATFVRSKYVRFYSGRLAVSQGARVENTVNVITGLATVIRE